MEQGFPGVKGTCSPTACMSPSRPCMFLDPRIPCQNGPESTPRARADLFHGPASQEQTTPTKRTSLGSRSSQERPICGDMGGAYTYRLGCPDTYIWVHILCWTDRVRKMREPQYGLGAGSSMLPCSRVELEFLSYSEGLLVKVGGQIILCSPALAWRITCKYLDIILREHSFISLCWAQSVWEMGLHT